MRAPASANSFENVRRTITPSSSSGSAVSPLYSKYASSTTSGRASGNGSSSPVGLFGRQAKVSTGIVVADLGAGELRRDAEERIRRRRRDRDRVAGPGERARAEQDQVVGARAEHDVLGLDARVVGDRAAQRRGSRPRG